MESRTPRTDSVLKLDAFLDGLGTVETVQIDFARQLETELEKANKLLLKTNQTHIENQQLREDLDGEREINQRLTDELADARAEIERLKVWLNENHAMDAMTIRNHARTIEKRDEDIKAKNKLVEQMRESLEWALSFPACTCDDHDTRWQEQACSCGHASRVQKAMAALEAAERGE